MKKLSAILAVALVLVMVLAMVPATFAAECHLVDGAGYKIKATNATGTVWADGTIGTGSASGRWMVVSDEASAAVFYVEAVTGGYKLYLKDGENKNYVAFGTAAGSGSLVAAADATVFTWNSDLNTLVVAETNRAFGAQDTSSYMNLSCYSTTNTSGYNWGQFVQAVAAPQPESQPASENASQPASSQTATTGTENPDPTGDNTGIVSMTAVMVLAVTALVVLVIGNKKKAF